MCALLGLAQGEVAPPGPGGAVSMEEVAMQDRQDGDEGRNRPEGGRSERIRSRIAEHFAPLQLLLEDQSARHAGHAGVREHVPAGGETHFALEVVSVAFQGLGRVQRSRAVHEALADEFRSGLHALSLTLRTPAEQAARPPERAGGS